MSSDPRPTGPADQEAISTHNLILNALQKYWPNWNKDGSAILPPTFKWMNPDMGRAELDEKEREAAHLRGVPSLKSQFSRAAKFRTLDESSHGEHLVYRAFDEVINSGEHSDLNPLFGFRNLNLTNGNGAFEKCVWDEVKEKYASPAAGSKSMENSQDNTLCKAVAAASLGPTNDATILGELDFTIIGSKIGIILVEVKSSVYREDFIIGNNCSSTCLRKDLKKFSRSTQILLALLEASIDGGAKIETQVPVRRIILFTNIERSRFRAWMESLPVEVRAYKMDSEWADLTVWCKEDVENKLDDKLRGPFFSALREVLHEMANDVAKLESDRKDSVKVIYERCVPILVGMKSLINGMSSGTSKHLDEEQLSILKALLAEEKKLDSREKALMMMNPKSESKSTKMQYFLLPIQQAILNSGPRLALFGGAGVGKTLVLREKIRQVILEERKRGKKLVVEPSGDAKRPQLPVMIVAPESICKEYDIFLRKCGFRKGTDYEIDHNVGKTYFDAYHRVLTILFHFAKREQRYTAMLAWILMFFVQKPARRKSYDPGAADYFKQVLDYFVKQGLLNSTFADRLHHNMKDIVDEVTADTFRALSDPTSLIALLRQTNAMDKFIGSFESQIEFASLVESFGICGEFVDIVCNAIDCRSKSKACACDPPSSILSAFERSYRRFLESSSELAARLRQLRDLFPIFTTYCDQIEETSDLQVLCQFIKDALNDAETFDQLKDVVPWTPRLNGDGTASGHSHLFVEDMLDRDNAPLRYPHTFEALTVLFMDLIRRIDPGTHVWVAIDPFKGHFDGYTNDDEIFTKTAENLRRLQNTDESIDGPSDRFEFRILQDVLRCSKQIFEHCYEGDDGTSELKRQALVKPRAGHNYMGKTPIIDRRDIYETFDDAATALWPNVKDVITFLEQQGFAQSQFALIVGNRYTGDTSLYDWLTSRCNEYHRSHQSKESSSEVDLQAHDLAIASNGIDSCERTRFIYDWKSVSSLEWLAVIYVNVLPKGVEREGKLLYRKYRGLSRAKLYLFEFEYLYRKLSPEEELCFKLGFKYREDDARWNKWSLFNSLDDGKGT